MTRQYIKNATISFLVISGMILLWGFASRENMQIVCTGYDISIYSSSNNYFTNAEEVEQIIIKHFDTLRGQHISHEMLKNLHRVVEKIPYTDHARVYRSINGRIGIDIYLREPLIRVINRGNESFYIDVKGYMFPLSEQHTARAMLATGHIDTYFRNGKKVFPGYLDDDIACPGELSYVFEVATYIHNNTFWNAFIDHIYVLPDNKLELIPRNGAHVIEFGFAENNEGKFRKLKLFYLHGITRKGWNFYSRINLEYKNQVICSK